MLPQGAIFTRQWLCEWRLWQKGRRRTWQLDPPVGFSRPEWLYGVSPDTYKPLELMGGALSKRDAFIEEARLTAAALIQPGGLARVRGGPWSFKGKLTAAAIREAHVVANQSNRQAVWALRDDKRLSRLCWHLNLSLSPTQSSAIKAIPRPRRQSGRSGPEWSRKPRSRSQALLKRPSGKGNSDKRSGAERRFVKKTKAPSEKNVQECVLS